MTSFNGEVATKSKRRGDLSPARRQSGTRAVTAERRQRRPILKNRPIEAGPRAAIEGCAATKRGSSRLHSSHPRGTLMSTAKNGIKALLAISLATVVAGLAQGCTAEIDSPEEPGDEATDVAGQEISGSTTQGFGWVMSTLEVTGSY